MKRSAGLALVLVALIALAAVGTSSASAAVECFKVDVGKGNWKGKVNNKECKEETGALEGGYVMGEGTGVRFPPNLECILIVPILLKTGAFTNGTCEKEEKDGPYTKAIRNKVAGVAVLSGAAFPVELSGSSATDKTEIQNAAGTVKGEGVSLTVTFESFNAGKYSAAFTDVAKGAEKCNSSGAAAGEVRVPATGTEPFTLDHDISASEGVAALLEVGTELAIACGSAKIKVKGNLLTLLGPVGGEKTTGFEAILRCSATVGEPQDVKYWNLENEEKSALLQANFGTGFKKSCEQVATNLPLSASQAIELIQ